MPLELQIIRATEFIQVGASGHFDLAGSKHLLAALVSACRKRGIHLALLDLRDLRVGPIPVFSPRDLADLLRTFPEIGFGPKDYLAILYHSDPHKRVRLFSFLSSMHGWNVKAFNDYEKAMLWLAKSQPSAPGPKRVPPGKSVPIQAGRSARLRPTPPSSANGATSKPRRVRA